MSEPESKKLEERLEAILAERGPLDPYLSLTVWEVARDALAALREKDEEIAHLNHLRHEDAVEIAALRAFQRGVDEALNSGDGSYRP